MPTRTTTAALALLASAGLTLTGCSSGESYSEKTDRCADAIAAQAHGDTTKPKPCEKIKQDDYDLLNADQGLKNLGVVDGDGNVDLSKLLDTPTP